MEHGIICRKPDTLFSYFGWGSVARLDEHTLVAACSGQRTRHICPFGKTELFYSFDEGRTWSEPMVINDTMLDDRDVGIVPLGGKKLLLTWFNHPLRYCDHPENDDNNQKFYHAYMDTVEPDLTQRHGSWIRLSDDGGFSWDEPQKLEVTSPHGPCVLSDGSILYLGKVMYSDRRERSATEYHRHEAPIESWHSCDGGKTWEQLGTVPVAEGTTISNYHEPHAIQLPSGRILGIIRVQGQTADCYRHKFTMFQTWSDDGGKTWSVPAYLDVSGSPPHLMRHSSGALICVYGRREAPFGERALISYDEGLTWSKDVELSRGDRPDLGYPCSVELADGSILTVYYQAWEKDPSTSFLWTRWSLDEV